MTVSTQIATPPKSTKSKNWDSSVSRGTNSNWDYGVTWICTEEFEFFDLVDFGACSIWSGKRRTVLSALRSSLLHCHISMHCNTPLHTATNCNTLQHTGLYYTVTFPCTNKRTSMFQYMCWSSHSTATVLSAFASVCLRSSCISW